MTMVGDTICSPTGDYKVKEILGSGSFGKVALCTKKPTTSLVALKIIEDDEAIYASKDEAKFLNMMRGLGARNFNIVEYVGSFMASEFFCLEFERLDMSVCDYMKNWSLKLREIRPIIQQMVEALYFLKGIKVVHADLKPENIMMVDRIRQPLRVKLIDFGLAHSDTRRWTGHMFGTLPYISPEVLLGAPYTHAIDTWALGCIAVEMLIGDVFIHGDNEAEQLRIIISLLGNVPDVVMDFGCFTTKYFIITSAPDQTKTWSLKFTEEPKCRPLSIKTVTELLKVPEGTPPEEVPAEESDRVSFVELIGEMLNMNHYKRITPSKTLLHSFLTLSHLDPYDNYLQQSIQLMRTCPKWNADKCSPSSSSSSSSSSSERSSIEELSTLNNLSGPVRHLDIHGDSPYFNCPAQQTSQVEICNLPSSSSPEETMTTHAGETLTMNLSRKSSAVHKSTTPPTTQIHSRKRTRNESDTETEPPPVRKKMLPEYCDIL